MTTQKNTAPASMQEFEGRSNLKLMMGGVGYNSLHSFFC